MFAFRDISGGVDVAFTDRHGGVSDGPYASLDLGHGRGDGAALAENLDRVTRAFAGAAPGVSAPRVVRMHQVHGGDVRVVDEQLLGSPAAQPPRVDALVTTIPGVVLMVRVADCVPVLLADPAAGVVGAAHAGRQGLVAGIVTATVAAMRDAGARQLRAWVGPHVCGACYEVPAAMRAAVGAVVPEAVARTSWGTPAVDVGAGVRAQLERADAEIVEVARCTVEDEHLFSYRRQGTESGRMAGLVWLRR